MGTDIKALINDRLTKGLCIVCGKELKMNATTTIIDPNYGEVIICGTHIVRGSTKINREDTENK